MPVSRFLRLLTLFAVLLSPLAMLHGPVAAAVRSAGGAVAPHHAASPSPARAAMADDHCPDREHGQETGTGAALDCAIACAALPATLDRLPAPLPALVPPAATPLSAGVHGLAPEAATPPPRRS